MTNHKLYSVWNQVPVTYYQRGVRRNPLQWIWHSWKINLAKRIVGTLKFASCLDVGCASGYMISEISKAYPKASYFGVDAFDKAVSFAQKKYPQINFQVAFADGLPFKKNTFDLIIFYETIEHVEDPLKSLLELKRVLSKEGAVILAMDSGSWLFRLVWWFWENTTGKVWKKAHLHPYKHNDLERLIKQSGFIVKERFFSHFGMEVVFVLNK